MLRMLADLEAFCEHRRPEQAIKGLAHQFRTCATPNKLVKKQAYHTEGDGQLDCSGAVGVAVSCGIQTRRI